jgi:Family of unknown function (DUF6314)
MALDQCTLVASLAGTWELRRSIDDGSSMTGIATFAERTDRGLDYCERGRLRLPSGQEIDAERRYVFAETPDGFAVFFAESPLRLFHRIALSRVGSDLVGEASHLCRDDHYDSRYEFRADGSFTVEHRVCGPRKRYVMLTRYARVSV